MFRVTQAREGPHVVIGVDGELSGDSVELLESICAQELRADNTVALVLRDLTSIDREGRALLKRLSGRGVQIEAKGVYDSYLVQLLRSAEPESEAPERQGVVFPS